jgi:hypothetical protein
MQRTEPEAFYEQRPNYDNSIPLNLAILASTEFGPVIRALVAEIVEHYRLRLKGTNALDQIETTLSMLVANLVNARRRDPTCFVAISMASGYFSDNAQGIGYRTFRRVIDYLANRSPAFITRHTGYYVHYKDEKDQQSKKAKPGKGKRTRIQMTDAFLKSLYGTHGKPSVLDIALNLNFDCIQLRETKKNKKAKAKSIKFEESEITAGMRVRLESWNQFLSENWTDLYVTDEQLNTLHKSRCVDLATQRRLVRIFNNNSFDEGGRFYGGWWQEVPSDWRNYITINWHPTRELDFSHMQPAMLYTKLGLQLSSYAYDIDGVPKTDKNKALIKKTFMQIINAKKGMRPPDDEQTADLPAGWNWKTLREAIETKHEPIKKFFRSGVGVLLQRIDADIAEDVMLSLMKRNILVLPIHDSFIVQMTHIDALRAEMLRAYQKRLRQYIGIKLRRSYVDKLGHFLILSTSGEMDAILDQVSALQGASEISKGYEGYFERKKRVQSDKSQDWLVHAERTDSVLDKAAAEAEGLNYLGLKARLKTFAINTTQAFRS